jgi:hypothetical protein
MQPGFSLVAVVRAARTEPTTATCLKAGCKAVVRAARKPIRPRDGIPDMRLVLLTLPVVLAVLFLLTACGGKGGGY